MEKNKEIKDILLIYSHLNTGGIETLIVRMVEWLSKNGYNITLFLQRGGHLLKELENLDNLNIIINDKSSRISRTINFYFLLKKYFRNIKYDLIYTFNPEGLLKSYLFKADIRLSGVYHPFTYHKKSRKNLIKFLKKTDKEFTDKLIFMNSSVKKSTEKYFNKKLNGFIFPIPIKLNKRSKLLGNVESKRIVSIGRIVDFKTYNFYMVDVMEKLIQKYPDYSYHIYGSGEYENKLIKKISKSSVKEDIFYHGRLDYDKLPEVLRNSFCFVGMGTSLIESSSLGVPGITALVNDKKAETYGFFNELPGYILGSEIKDREKYKVIDKIEEVINMKPEEYKLLCKKAQRKAKSFDIDNVMESFFDNISLKKNKEIDTVKFSKYFYFKIMNKLKYSLLNSRFFDFDKN